MNEQKLNKCLDGMMQSDIDLYERILDTNGFAFHFNNLCNLAKGSVSNPTAEAGKSAEEILRKNTKIARPNVWAYWNDAIKAMHEFSNLQNASLLQELHQAKEEIERLKEFEWMYNYLSK